MRAVPLPPSRHVSTCSAVYNPLSPGMVRQIFRFEILPLVLYVGISAHFNGGKLHHSSQDMVWMSQRLQMQGIFSLSHS